jgi:hypothetical protein
MLQVRIAIEVAAGVGGWAGAECRTGGGAATHDSSCRHGSTCTAYTCACTDAEVAQQLLLLLLLLPLCVCRCCRLR